MTEEDQAELARRHCKLCETARTRLKVNGVYACPKCDEAWAMPNVRKQAGL